MTTTKTKKHPTTPSPKGKTKIEKLQLNKETLKDLSARDGEQVRGGQPKQPLGMGSQAGCCWVARAVYGESNPRWLLYREWLLGEAPAWFRRLYIRHGERFAIWLAPHSAVKSVIRLWMDWVIDRRCAGARLSALSAR